MSFGSSPNVFMATVRLVPPTLVKRTDLVDECPTATEPKSSAGGLTQPSAGPGRSAVPVRLTLGVLIASNTSVAENTPASVPGVNATTTWQDAPGLNVVNWQ